MGRLGGLDHWDLGAYMHTFFAVFRGELGFEEPVRRGGLPPLEEQDGWDKRQQADHQRGAHGSAPGPAAPFRLLVFQLHDASRGQRRPRRLEAAQRMLLLAAAVAAMAAVRPLHEFSLAS
ncbi:hypothetical protein GUJ93_ZPchr0006g43178 [Zizania palustris]|uniref:Uncharacterized protein n=1 Tax=Zizania palustris TaxID=103762 RepID=A0A8J5W264_ZIZPA|nr:hypothetical protein GUJ93_ZPchr0006g43178 [Zizania palustris]